RPSAAPSEAERPSELDERGVAVAGFDTLIDVLARGRDRQVDQAIAFAHRLVSCFSSGHKLLVCGNGGSAADAQHLAGELVARFRSSERRALPVIVLGSDLASLTAWSNDVG